MTLYRVFPHLPSAAPDVPGGPLYVPPQGAGRLDNPDLFAVLYLGDSEAGAVAEAFGRFTEWTTAMLEGSPSLPGSKRSVARYRLREGPPLCNLDDAERLVELRRKPSDVVSRSYGFTRAWARRIHQQRRWAGIRWWSYYDPRWSSAGVWNREQLTLEEVWPLRLRNPAVEEAARTIVRRILL
jgi:hypothetical protein